MLKPDWKEAAIYSVKPILMFDTDYITMLIAMVGTSIAPWMQFYLQSAIVEKGITAKEYVQSRVEVVVGCILTDVVAFFIIVSCATAIWAHGPRDINDAADAAVALKPFGQYAYLLFSAGLFNASFFAACILPLSTVFTVCEGLGFESGVDKRFHEAPEFYWLYTLLVVLGAGVILWPNFPLVKMILASQVHQWRAAAVRADLHGAADQQEGPDEGMDQFGGLQRGGLGFGGDHDRPHAGAGFDHGETNDAAGQGRPIEQSAPVAQMQRHDPGRHALKADVHESRIAHLIRQTIGIGKFAD